MNAKRTASAKAKIVDWRDINRRLEAARTNLDRGWVRGPEERRRILNARAKALAREPDSDSAAAQTVEVIEFTLAYERYAVDSSFVREVCPLTDLTPLPCTPAFVLGIVNVRGEIVSIIDLRKFFDLPEKGLTELNKAVILHSDAMTFGILADLVVGAHELAVAEIRPPLPTHTGMREEYLVGVTKDRIAVLDAAKLLSDKKMIVHETVDT